MPSLSLCPGLRCVPEPRVTFEDILLAGEKTWPEKILSGSRTNKTFIFIKETDSVNERVGSELEIMDSRSVKVTISNVPPFIPDEVFEVKSLHFSKMASKIQPIYLRLKIKH